jgi:cell division protease FtsH
VHQKTVHKILVTRLFRVPRLVRWGLFAALLAAASVGLIARLSSSIPVPPVPYTFFREQVDAGNVSELVIQGETIRGVFKQPVVYPPRSDRQRILREFITVQPIFADPSLAAALSEQRVTIDARSATEPKNSLVDTIIRALPALLVLGLLVFMGRSLGLSQAFRMGQSTARRYDAEGAGSQGARFDQVAGIDEARNELVEIVDFLKSPERFNRLGGTVPKGVLLVGRPGTGKTLLARAVAGEAGVPFFSIGASEFVEMVVGVGASRVRDLFKRARAAAPSIIFIDELDAIGRSRGDASFGSNRESEQALNQILTEMDGFSPREAVIVIAATNRLDVLDPALLRPGRFDRRVHVHLPDKAGRLSILQVHARDIPLDQDVDFESLARSTTGLSGADLRNVLNEAALLAARNGQESVTQANLRAALEKQVLGPARQIVMSPEELERVAYHESGHALLGLLVPGADRVSRVTIIPRGQSLGATHLQAIDDRQTYSEEHLRARIIGTLGGRAAEQVVYGNRTTAAQNDLKVATTLARGMVTLWGMSSEIGPLSFTQGTGRPQEASDTSQLAGAFEPLSESTARLIDGEIRAIIEQCNDQAVSLLRQHRNELDALVTALLEHETLDEEEIATFCENCIGSYPPGVPLRR